MLHQVEAGDSVWAFTRNGEGQYVLAAELVVRAKTRNRPDCRYGPYRVWGDLKLNQHRAVHRMDAPLDWADMAFDFGVRRERVVVDWHLVASSLSGV